MIIQALLQLPDIDSNPAYQIAVRRQQKEIMEILIQDLRIQEG